MKGIGTEKDLFIKFSYLKAILPIRLLVNRGLETGSVNKKDDCGKAIYYS